MGIRATIIRLGPAFPPGSSDQPGTRNGTGHPWSPIWSCCGRGLPSRRVSPPLVRSYRRHFTLTGPKPFVRRDMEIDRRYLFCGAFRSEGLWPRAPGSYPAPRPVAVRTFLPPAWRKRPPGGDGPLRPHRGGYQNWLVFLDIKWAFYAFSSGPSFAPLEASEFSRYIPRKE